jgi:hypothetical protein
MSRWGWMALAGLIGGACGHATPTGSAQNNWATTTGYANATDPRYINPMAAAHRAKHYNWDLASSTPPPVQPQGSAISTEPTEAVPPPAEPMPPPEAVPDTTPPNTMPRDTGEVPPSVAPPLP